MAKLFVVGIGASAGGLEALKPLLKNLQKTGRMVCIIAQHMHSGAHTELMVKLLASESRLSVSIAQDGELLSPDQVYLIPAGYDGLVKAGKLLLVPPSKSSYTKPSINILLNSIGAEYHHDSAGIILSGVGADGAKGCLAIKLQGGLTIAQHPADAKFDSMPREAIRTGAVQYVMEPEKMGTLLASCLQQLHVTALQGTRPFLQVNDTQLANIMQMVLRVTGVDFSRYKSETIMRRINARMAYLNISYIDAYMKYCVSHSDEIHHLQQSLLVSSSHFFRDPASFDSMKSLIAGMIRQKSAADTIRVYVPACASGEECYSLAILFREIINGLPNPPSLKITGRDLNAKAIRKAQEAWYPLSALKQVDRDLLGRYFVQEGTGYRVNHQLRSCCQFELADIFNTASSAHFDIISCRNFLIYLQPDLQMTLLKSFYTMLNHDGLLFLGQSESVGEYTGRYFLPLNHAHKIFQRRQKKIYEKNEN